MRRLHTLSGLVPLGAYLIWHLWEHWPVLQGRDALLQRLDRTAGSHGMVVVELLFILLPLGVHGWLGLRLRREVSGGEAYASAGMRRLQSASGLGLGVFLLGHLAVVWLPRWRSDASPAVAYQALLDALGHFGAVVFYAMGLSAVCLHFGQGLSVAWLHLVPRSPAKVVRGVSALIALGWWVMSVNVLAAYVTGAGLW